MLKWRKGVEYMGILKGGQNISHRKEEKLRLVLRNLSGETATSI